MKTRNMISVEDDIGKIKKEKRLVDEIEQNIELDIGNLDIKSELEPIENYILESNNTTETLGDENFKLENSNPKLEENTDDKNERHQCSHCDKSFSTKITLTRHIKETHFELKKSFKCEECGALLSRKTALTLHMRLHNGERPEICSICSKAFRTPQALEVHFSIHTGKKRFSCSFCEKKFRIKADLQIHERVHTGEKPAQCDICGGRFRSTGALTAHRKQHDKYYKSNSSNTRKKRLQRKFQCRLCLTVLNQSSLKQHKMVHSETKDYFCTICRDYFQTFSSLTSHMYEEHGCDKASKENYIFIGNNDGNDSLFREVLDVKEIGSTKIVKEKQFACQICGSSFTTTRSLKRHERGHGERKDYKCNMCDGAFFRTYTDMDYHMKSKHGCLPKAKSNYTLIGGRCRK